MKRFFKKKLNANTPTKKYITGTYDFVAAGCRKSTWGVGGVRLAVWVMGYEALGMDVGAGVAVCYASRF